MRRNISDRTALLLVALLWAVIGVVYFKRYAILDWWRLHNYTPPPAIAQLAGDDRMTALGKTLLYINHPVLQSRSAFNQACPPGSEHTIVLGCYHPDEQGIFLFTVSDSRLQGVEQVTAAHEMLHAAYQRLDPKTRSYVDGLLQDYYAHALHDSAIQAEIAAYKKSEPHDVVNEMHSVFGTEVLNLPPALESYYRRYFIDRKEIAQFSAQYRSVFSSRETEVANYDAELAQMKSEIATSESNLNTQLSAIDSEKSQLDAARASGPTSNFNSEVANYNQTVNTYNTLVDNTRSLITSYNQIVSERNAVAIQENQLSAELNSASTIQ